MSPGMKPAPHKRCFSGVQRAFMPSLACLRNIQLQPERTCLTRS